MRTNFSKNNTRLSSFAKFVKNYDLHVEAIVIVQCWYDSSLHVRNYTLDPIVQLLACAQSAEAFVKDDV